MAKKEEQEYKVLIGRPRAYETPEELQKEANDYFNWCINNPIKKQEIVKYRDTHTKDDVNIERPFSLQGFCNFAGIHTETFRNYQEKKDFFEVTRTIRQIIESQQFEGATAGIFNANIIARKLGLADKSDINLKTKKKEIANIFPDELNESLDEDS